MTKRKLVSLLCIIQLLITNHHHSKSVDAEIVMVAKYHQPDDKSDTATRRVHENDLSINSYKDAFAIDEEHHHLLDYWISIGLKIWIYIIKTIIGAWHAITYRLVPVKSKGQRCLIQALASLSIWTSLPSNDDDDGNYLHF